MKNIAFATFALLAAAASAECEEKGRDVRIVDVEASANSFWDESCPVDPGSGAVCCLAAVTNSVSGGPSRWVTFDGRGWNRLQCEVSPVAGVTHYVRIEMDFTDAESKIRYSVKRSDGEYAVLRDEKGREWLPSPTPNKKVFSTVKVCGESKAISGGEAAGD